jgi:SAM-dependent methyltransferase
MREGYEGTGPGAITPDGCAVELYKRVGVRDEPDIICRAVPAGAHILELGCGAGRVTHALLERGFTVTAVDESADMLAHVRGARTVLSPIEHLDLGEKFDVVMLASYLVNAGDPNVRRGLLTACRGHVADGGCVLLQREGDDWHDTLPWERVDPSGYTVRMSLAESLADGADSLFAEYVFPDVIWTQKYHSRQLSKAAFEAALAEADLRADRYLTDDGTWVRAVAAARPPAPRLIKKRLRALGIRTLGSGYGFGDDDVGRLRAGRQLDLVRAAGQVAFDRRDSLQGRPCPGQWGARQAGVLRPRRRRGTRLARGP